MCLSHFYASDVRVIQPSRSDSLSQTTSLDDIDLDLEYARQVAVRPTSMRYESLPVPFLPPAYQMSLPSSGT
jgi:hypothetical protein